MIPCSSPFYQNKRFSQFYPIVGIYSLVIGTTNLIASKVLRLPFFVPTVLRDEDCFRIPTSHNNAETCKTNQRPVALVTGANTGIGYETALSLVYRGYDVVLGCRSRDKGEAAARSIQQTVLSASSSSNTSSTLPTSSSSSPSSSSSSHGSAIFVHPLDLSSLDSVRDFVEVLVRDNPDLSRRLSVLVNNAGINSTGRSVDGLDLCFQTNFLGHYLLTRLLLPILKEAKNVVGGSNKGIIGEGGEDEVVEGGRIVNLSSVTHHFSHPDEERRYSSDLDAQSSPSSSSSSISKHKSHDAKWWRGCTLPGVSNNTYKESKLAAVLFTHELNTRYGKQIGDQQQHGGIRAISANPGAVNSDIWRTSPKFSMENLVRHLYLTPKQGASTSIAAAVGNLPLGAVYLQPYWLPRWNTVWGGKRSRSSFGRRYRCPFPVFEAMGPYVGHAVTDPRLPDDCDVSSKALWDVCEDIVGEERLRPVV